MPAFAMSSDNQIDTKVHTTAGEEFVATANLPCAVLVPTTITRDTLGMKEIFSVMGVNEAQNGTRDFAITYNYSGNRIVSFTLPGSIDCARSGWAGNLIIIGRL